AQVIARRLAGLGISARTKVAKTGVVGDLGSDSDAPCIALRADMDALPIQELNDVPYASQVPGVMHACGHDVHVACLLGAAQLLAEEAEAGRLPGRIRFLFQPSEESQDDQALSGAMRMVDEGVMEGVDAVAGLHVWADLPVGTIGLRKGTASAYPDKFELEVKGQEAHGAYPHRGHDAINLAAQVINALQTVVSRRLDPTRAKVLTVGTIQGGTKDNIVAGKVTMTGTIRTFEPDVREALFAEMERACSVARALGGDYELRIIPGYIPVVNDPDLTDLVRRVASDMLGPEQVQESTLEMGGEDFSYFAREAPGTFFLLGGRTPGAPPRLHHHPEFDIDERCLPLGAALLAEIALAYLRDRNR
ncbi:MAG: M20 family metallopeptidase, partial [Anaerolineae bacterium]|nr:M20 family metallopeptidase [Anaerolineae bacterium]